MRTRGEGGSEHDQKYAFSTQVYGKQYPKLRVHPARTFPRPGARFLEVCTRSVHVFLRVYHYYIVEECMEKIPGAQF